MSKWFEFAVCALTLAPIPSAAQDSAGAVITDGIDGDMARGMLVQMGANRGVNDNCWKLGCVLIVNQTKSCDVVGFYVGTAKPGTTATWSRNQFGDPLRPMKVTMRFKAGGADMCNSPVRFVLCDRETKEKLDVAGNASLCTSPHQDTLLQIKAPKGTVIVLPADPSSPTPSP